MSNNYPLGIHAGRSTVINLHCNSCDHNWDAAAWREYGVTDLIDEADRKCPNCGKWSEDE